MPRATLTQALAERDQEVKVLEAGCQTLHPNLGPCWIQRIQFYIFVIVKPNKGQKHYHF